MDMGLRVFAALAEDSVSLLDTCTVTDSCSKTNSWCYDALF